MKSGILASIVVSVVLVGGLVFYEDGSTEDPMKVKHTRCAAYALIAGMNKERIEAHSGQGYADEEQKNHQSVLALKDAENLLAHHSFMSIKDAAQGLYEAGCAHMVKIKKERYTRQRSI